MNRKKLRIEKKISKPEHIEKINQSITTSLICLVLFLAPLYFFDKTIAKVSLIFLMGAIAIATTVRLTQKISLFHYFFVTQICGYASVLSCLIFTAAIGKALSRPYALNGNLFFGAIIISFIIYSFFPIRYYLREFSKNPGKRLKAFDFQHQTYAFDVPALGIEKSYWQNKSYYTKLLWVLLAMTILFSFGILPVVLGLFLGDVRLLCVFLGFYWVSLWFLDAAHRGIYQSIVYFRIWKQYGSHFEIIYEN